MPGSRKPLKYENTQIKRGEWDEREPRIKKPIEIIDNTNELEKETTKK